MRRALLLASFAAALLLVIAPLATVWAQVPIPMQEQVDRFNTLSASDQQALIRELQRELPPAQRDAVINMLRQQQEGQSPGVLDDADAMLDDSQRRQTRTTDDDAFGPERLSAGDTIVMELLEKEEPEGGVPEEEQLLLNAVQERLLAANPYQLDSIGRLYLPGIPAIQLAGLDIDQATVRIQAERELAAFDVVLTHLQLDPVGSDALERFGRYLFDAGPSAFEPATDIPIPAGYVIGPGDTINIQLFGNQNSEFFLTVSREGSINFPQIGPITVAGLTVTELRTTINERVSEQMIGVRASTTMGELRSVRVFVLGDVEFPGSYLVSGLSTMTNALFESGGVSDIGSLRNVSLRRAGQTVSTLDLYDLLLRGDTSGDARLEPGDVIFVPPIGTTVAVDGEVRRPAIYEIRNENTVASVIGLAGGLAPNANRSGVKLERIVSGRGTTVLDIDMAIANSDLGGIADGDIIRVEPNLAQLENSVELAGNVFRPGRYQLSPRMTLLDLLPAPELVKPMSDLNYVLIRRENRPNVEVDILSADLEAIWQRRPGANNLALKARDTIYVFSLDVGRQHIIQPLIEELNSQAITNQPAPVISIGGQVRASGEYPLEPGMRIADLLRAGGGLTASAYAIDAELTRYAVIDGSYRETGLIDVDLAAVLSGDAMANLALAPYDYLSIKEVPRWRELQSVAVLGEVTFPGEFPIRQGETLSSVLERAGGLTELAFPRGSVFTREELRQRESEQLETLARRIETDLAAVALADPNASDAIGTGQTLVDQLRDAEAVGRLVIDLRQLADGDLARDIVLRDGDQLFVPQITQEVMVLGEVQYSTSHVYTPTLGRDNYIDLSGGMTTRADKRRVYVVRADGSVVADSGGRWFRRSSGTEMAPGDTIVVPLDTDRVRPLVAWQGITQILYNIAIAFSVIDRL